MTNLTDKQIAHRQFIQSPLWSEIRAKALQHYGCVCGKCGNHGTDVHHKTYRHFGGNESMDELQVLCRSCHDALHTVERALRTVKRSGKRPWIRAVAAYRYLTQSQKDLLCQEFQLRDSVELFNRVGQHRGVMQRMRRLLNVNIIEYNKRVFNKIGKRNCRY